MFSDVLIVCIRLAKCRRPEFGLVANLVWAALMKALSAGCRKYILRQRQEESQSQPPVPRVLRTRVRADRVDPRSKMVAF